MIEDDGFDPVEYLKEIRRRESEFLYKIYVSGRLSDYILYLNHEMYEKYPDMIIDVINNEDSVEREQ